MKRLLLICIILFSIGVPSYKWYQSIKIIDDQIEVIKDYVIENSDLKLEKQHSKIINDDLFKENLTLAKKCKKFDDKEYNEMNRVFNTIYKFRPDLRESHYTLVSDMAHAFIDAGKKYGFDPILLVCISYHEAALQFDRKSIKGAIGLMQVMPENLKKYGVKNQYDVTENIFAGTRYLKKCFEKFRVLELALAAYNAGPGEVIRNKGIPPFKETQLYTKNILNTYNKIRG